MENYHKFCLACKAGDEKSALSLTSAIAHFLEIPPCPRSSPKLYPQNNLSLIRYPTSTTTTSSSFHLPNVSPLYVALQHKCFNVVRHLLSLHSQVATQLLPTATELVHCFDCESLLHLASRQGNNDIISLLLDLGASTELQGCRVGAPLHLAAEHNRLEAITLLLDHGADIEVRDSSGNSPLHVAAAWDRLEVIRMLLARGADIKARAVFGEDVYNIAICRGAQQVLKFLCKLDVQPMYRASCITLPRPLLLLPAFPGKCKAFTDLFMDLISRSQCPDELKADALLISATCRIFSKKSESIFKEGLRLHEALPNPFNLHSVAWYGGRTEVLSVKEWEEVKMRGCSSKDEFFFQRCMILERCLGCSHPYTYHHMRWPEISSNTREIYALQLRCLELFVSREELKFELCAAPLFPHYMLKIDFSPNRENFPLFLECMLRGVEVCLKMRSSHSTCTAFETNPTLCDDPIVSMLHRIARLFSEWLLLITPPPAFAMLTEWTDLTLPNDPNLHALGHRFVSLASSSLRGKTLLSLVVRGEFSVQKSSNKVESLVLLKAVLEWIGGENINLPDPDTGHRPLHAAHKFLGEAGAFLLLSFGAHMDSVSRESPIFLPQCELASSLAHPSLLSPLPLSCMCCWAVLQATGTLYQLLKLPIQIRELLMLHEAL